MRSRASIIVIVFSLLGVAILYSISALIVPPYVPLDDVAAHEGSFIRTKGVISDFSVTESGYILMKLRDNQTELLLFIDSVVNGKNFFNLSYGDEIEVEGRVQVYEGEYELVASERAVTKVKQERALSFVSLIALHPEEYEGRRICVVGYLTDVYTRVFYLCDEQGTYRMRVKTQDVPISDVHEGDKIIAEGILSYDPENLRYELNLIAMRHCD